MQMSEHFTLFVQSLKSQINFVPGGTLSWPEKVNTDRFRKSGKEERVPQAQSGLQRVAGLGLWLGDTSEPHWHTEPCPACFSCLMAVPSLAS